MTARIPTLDIRRLQGDRVSFVAELGAAYREWGFAGIRGHGIPVSAIDAMYDALRRFFALDETRKRRYHVQGASGARGYTPFGVETARDAQHSDLKEFWHVGREIPRDSRYAAAMPENLWPAEVPGFRDRALGLYGALDRLGSSVLSALALHLELPVDFFVRTTDSGNSILRFIHYPPVDQPAGAPALPNERAAQHEDINLITLLVGASAEGLEVRSRSGDWVPFTADADTIVVNIGDMLQRLTNHALPSTTHRVVKPAGRPGESRYSMPFFLHPNPDYLIEVLPSMTSIDNPSRYPEPITAQAYLEQRLREIRLS